MVAKRKRYEKKPQPVKRVHLKKKRGFISGKAKVDRSKNIYPHNGEASILAFDIALENSILHKTVMNYIGALDLGKTPRSKFFIPAMVTTPGSFPIKTYIINKDGIYLLKDLLINDKAIEEYADTMDIMNFRLKNNHGSQITMNI